jgi:phenol 2-monooxygenase
VFVDDESYNSGHGHAFDTIEVDHEAITIVVVRPDQCKSMANIKSLFG